MSLRIYDVRGALVATDPEDSRCDAPGFTGALAGDPDFYGDKRSGKEQQTAGVAPAGVGVDAVVDDGLDDHIDEVDAM